MRWRLVTLLCTTLALGALALGALGAGCIARPGVAFIPDGGARTMAEVQATAKTADLSPARGVRAADAQDARTDVLVSLRRKGPDGERAASLLTQGFPTRTQAVPVHVEIARVDGVRSLIVVEATADTSGALVNRRLWVFDMATGSILGTGYFR